MSMRPGMRPRIAANGWPRGGRRGGAAARGRGGRGGAAAGAPRAARGGAAPRASSAVRAARSRCRRGSRGLRAGMRGKKTQKAGQYAALLRFLPTSATAPASSAPAIPPPSGLNTQWPQSPTLADKRERALKIKETELDGAKYKTEKAIGEPQSRSHEALLKTRKTRKTPDSSKGSSKCGLQCAAPSGASTKTASATAHKTVTQKEQFEALVPDTRANASEHGDPRGRRTRRRHGTRRRRLRRRGCRRRPSPLRGHLCRSQRRNLRRGHHREQRQQVRDLVNGTASCGKESSFSLVVSLIIRPFQGARLCGTTPSESAPPITSGHTSHRPSRCGGRCRRALWSERWLGGCVGGLLRQPPKPAQVSRSYRGIRGLPQHSPNASTQLPLTSKVMGPEPVKWAVVGWMHCFTRERC